MKDQEIDKLFKDRLLEKEVTPSPRAWAALESQLDQQERHRRIGFWWIPAAAAMLAGIGLGMHLYTAQPGQQAALLPKEATMVAAETPAVKQAASLPQIAQRSTSHQPAHALPSHTRQAKPEHTGRLPVTKKEAGKPGTEQPSVNKPVDVAQQQPPITDEPSDPLLQDAVAVNTAADVNEDGVTVIIKMEAEAETETSGSTTEHKKTRAGRILKQLKNFKNGEEVDLKALGINTDKLPFKRSAD